jgi:hypothetical protein
MPTPSMTGTGDFLMVSAAVNHAPPCYTTTIISPFQNIGEIGWGVYGEVDYFYNKHWKADACSIFPVILTAIR